jgi:uncharacterized protein (DUF4415 family)
MDTPESKRDALLSDLGLDAELLERLADQPLPQLDIPFVALPEGLDHLPPAPEPRLGTLATPAAHPPGATTKSIPITIRVPRAVLSGFKMRAAAGGAGYQTLMVRALREWISAPPRI